MFKRIVWAAVLGFAFAFLVVQSQVWPAAVFGVILFLAQLEFWRLHQGSFKAIHLLYAAGGLAFWAVCAIALAYQLKLAPILVVVMAAIMLLALVNLAKYTPGQGGGYSMLAWWLKSLLAVSLPFAFVVSIAAMDSGPAFLLLLIGASWAADSGAIFCGKLFGKLPLAPKISPNKTIEGAVGGMAAAGFSFYFVYLLFPEAVKAPFASGNPLVSALVYYLAGAFIALIGICGDLYFSMLKRQVNIKDYSQIIPGHGGVLDRFDSMLFAAPLVYLLAVLLLN